MLPYINPALMGKALKSKRKSFASPSKGGSFKPLGGFPGGFSPLSGGFSPMNIDPSILAKVAAMKRNMGGGFPQPFGAGFAPHSGFGPSQPMSPEHGVLDPGQSYDGPGAGGTFGGSSFGPPQPFPGGGGDMQGRLQQLMQDIIQGRKKPPQMSPWGITPYDPGAGGYQW